MEYHILTNIHRNVSGETIANNEPHRLLKPIINRDGEKKIGIKSITYYVGYVAIERDEYIRKGEGDFTKIPPGIYSIDEMIEIFKKKIYYFTH